VNRMEKVRLLFTHREKACIVPLLDNPIALRAKVTRLLNTLPYPFLICRKGGIEQETSWERLSHLARPPEERPEESVRCFKIQDQQQATFRPYGVYQTKHLLISFLWLLSAMLYFVAARIAWQTPGLRRGLILDDKMLDNATFGLPAQ